MMKIGTLKLRDLNDEEYAYAEALCTQIKGKNLDYCPTCRKRFPADIEDEVPRTYYYDGQTRPCNCQEQIALFARYLLAGIPEQYMRLDYADYEGSDNAKWFVNSYLGMWKDYRDNGFGVELGGPKLGIGKTFTATYLGKELIKRRQKVLFIPFVEMVTAFERTDAEEVEGKLRWTPYVILDDIMPPVSERQKNFYHTRFEAIIRHRTNYNLPTIITTNISAENLEEYYPRTYSLLAAKQVRIDMTGKDYRSQMGFDNMELIANKETRPIT